MTSLAKNVHSAPRRVGFAVRASFEQRTTFVRKDAVDEALEDARLNAIADERAGGPFVRVSLDDL